MRWLESALYRISAFLERGKQRLTCALRHPHTRRAVPSGGDRHCHQDRPSPHPAHPTSQRQGGWAEPLAAYLLSPLAEILTGSNPPLLTLSPARDSLVPVARGAIKTLFIGMPCFCHTDCPPKNVWHNQQNKSSLSLPLSLPHVHTHTHTHALTRTHTHTNIHAHRLTRTHTHTHTSDTQTLRAAFINKMHIHSPGTNL